MRTMLRDSQPALPNLRGSIWPMVFLAAGLTACLVSSPGWTQTPGDEVGRMTVVENDVTGTPPGGVATAMAERDPVVLDHLIETGRASFAEMLLGSEGVLSLGQEVQLRVDRMTIDQATGRTESVLELLLGKIELALGSLFRGEVTVETPTASLGVKGTVLRVLVLPSGRTLAAVLEGTVEVTSRAGGTVTVEAGEFTLVEEDAAPLPPAPFDPSAGTLSPSAAGPDFAVPGEDLFPETPLLDGRQLDLPREPPVGNQRGASDEPNEPPR